MTVHLEIRSLIEAPTETVFDLALSVKIHTDSMSRYGEQLVKATSSEHLQLGDEVTWRARHMGIRWRMTSRITEFERPISFVDEQTQGPFRRFRHEHRFYRDGIQTRMVDRVEFTAPIPVLGAIAERLVLRPYILHLIIVRNRHLRTAAEKHPRRMPSATDPPSEPTVAQARVPR